jgi:hypothetical protein
MSVIKQSSGVKNARYVKLLHYTASLIASNHLLFLSPSKTLHSGWVFDMIEKGCDENIRIRCG